MPFPGIDPFLHYSAIRNFQTWETRHGFQGKSMVETWNPCLYRQIWGVSEKESEWKSKPRKMYEGFLEWWTEKATQIRKLEMVKSKTNDFGAPNFGNFPITMYTRPCPQIRWPASNKPWAISCPAAHQLILFQFTCRCPKVAVCSLRRDDHQGLTCSHANQTSAAQNIQGSVASGRPFGEEQGSRFGRPLSFTNGLFQDVQWGWPFYQSTNKWERTSLRCMCSRKTSLMVFGFCLVGLEESLEVAVATKVPKRMRGRQSLKSGRYRHSKKNSKQLKATAAS